MSTRFKDLILRLQDSTRTAGSSTDVLVISSDSSTQAVCRRNKNPPWTLQRLLI
jgi:hypothetical protein